MTSAKTNLRRVIIGIIVIIIIIAIILPLVMGLIVKHDVENIIVGAKYPKNVQVKLSNYDLGWFNSTATVEIVVPTPKFMKYLTSDNNAILPKQLTYTAHLNIHHGPVTSVGIGPQQRRVFVGEGVVDGEVIMTNPDPKLFTAIQGIAQPTHMLASFNSSGKLIIEAIHGPFTITDRKDDVQLNIAGTDATIETTRALKTLNVNSQLQNVTITSKQAQANLGNVLIASDLTLNKESGLWLGNKRLTIPQISVTSGKQALVTVNNVEFNAATAAKDNQLNATTGLTIASVSSPISNQAKLDNVNVQLGAHQLNIAPLAKLVKFVRSDQFDQTKDKDMDKVILPLLSQTIMGSKYTMAVGVTSPLGHMNISGVANLPEKVTNPNKAMPQALQLILQAHANATLKFPADAVQKLMGPVVGGEPGPVEPGAAKSSDKQKQIDQGGVVAAAMISSLSDQGYLVKEGNEYVCHIVYKDQKVIINGKVVWPQPKKHHNQASHTQTNSQTNQNDNGSDWGSTHESNNATSQRATW